MAKKSLEQNLLAAHMNALNQTLSAVETQVASVKTLLKMSKASAVTSDESEDEEEIEDEKPAKSKKKAAKKKPAKVEDEEEDEDESDDEESEDEETDEDESEDDDGDEDESDDEETDEDEGDDEDEEPKKISKAQVVKAFKDYAERHNRAKALKVLAKFNVKSIHDLKTKQYPDVVALLKK